MYGLFGLLLTSGENVEIFRNIFTEKNAVFNTYFTRCIQRRFTPILINGRNCNAQYGGIVPPSK